MGFMISQYVMSKIMGGLFGIVKYYSYLYIDALEFPYIKSGAST